MSYMALYRKWRPDTFEDVKGQDHIVQTLKNQIMAHRIGHAYLFCGTRGTGKTSVAKIFAKAVNCESPKDGSPCNECSICHNISSGSSLNVVEIDAASNNGVENIREIRDQVQYPPTEGKYRVYIIDEVHMLSTGAFNALLKTLEEPPEYVIFILATTEVNKIPVTVLSRCQRYDFKRISIDVLTERMKELITSEKINVEEKALKYVAKAADGSMRDALSLLDQCVAFHYGETLTYENVLEVLGAVDNSVFSNMFKAVVSGKTADCIYGLEDMIMQGRELSQFVLDFVWYMRNLLLLKTADNAEDMLDMSSDTIAELKEEAKSVSSDTLMRYIRVMSELSNQIRYSAQKRVLIELAFIRLTKPSMENSMDSVIQRLEQVEKQLENGILPNQIGHNTVNVVQSTGSVEKKDAREVKLPKAQYEDLKLVKNEWGKIVQAMGTSIRPSFHETTLEPSGDSCLCIVFATQGNFDIGNRPRVLTSIEDYVSNTYGKKIYFKARLSHESERLDTIYVSDEDIKKNINMEITIEDN